MMFEITLWNGWRRALRAGAAVGLLTTLAAPATATPAHAAGAVAMHHAAAAEANTASHPWVSHTWLRFRDRRGTYVDLLGKPLLDCAQAGPRDRAPVCLQRIETFEVPYALTALYRATRDPRYGEAAERVFDAGRVERVEQLGAYASAWFLAFARERELATRKTDLQKAGDAVAARLEAALQDLDDTAFAQGALFGSENNVAWTLLNLWQWAEHRSDRAMMSRIVGFTKQRMLGEDMDAWCPMPVDGTPERFEFLPPCLQRAMTVLAILPEELSNPWLEEFVAAQDRLAPVHQPHLSTHGSLNFSRSWGLWSLYRATGKGQYRDMYVAHMEAQLGQMERDADKGTADHWQAAFGVYAMVLSM